MLGRTQWWIGEQQTRVSGKMLRCFIGVVSVNQRKWDNCRLLIRSEGARQEGEMLYVSTPVLGVLAARRIPFIRFRERRDWMKVAHTERSWKEVIHTQEKVKLKCNHWNYERQIGLPRGRKHLMFADTCPCHSHPSFTEGAFSLTSPPALTDLEPAACQACLREEE